MKIPTPSFVKIRIVALILGFILLFFCIGFVKNVFADWPGECTFILKWQDSVISFGAFPESWSLNAGTGFFEYQSTTNDSGDHPVGLGLTSYYYENNQWISVHVKQFGSLVSDLSYDGETLPSKCPCDEEDKQDQIAACGGEGHYEWDEDNCHATCINTCKDMLDLLIETCGGFENVIWDPGDGLTTCQGSCDVPCSGDGEETESEAAARCAMEEKELLYYLGEPTCRGVCSGNCSQEDINREKEKCSPYGLASFSEVTCTGTCNNCQDKKPEAEAICASQGKTYLSHTCDADGNVEPKCSDGEDPEVPPTPPTDPGTDPPDPPTDPPPEEPPTDPGPEDPEDPNDAELEAINENLKTIVRQNNDRANQLNSIDNTTQWIGENQKITANNTYAIGQKLDVTNDLLNDLNNKQGRDTEYLAGIEENTDSIDDTLKSISHGSYQDPTIPDKYETEEYSFSDRTSEFLSSMKETGIFSLPDKLSSSIPSGGSSILEIDGGETYGSHTIDFADYSSAILILRSLFQIAGMILAIRIVTLKR